MFIAYLIILCYFLFFSEEMGRTYCERSYHYNLVPFREIRRFLRYWKALGIGTVMINLVGNVAAFMPFGIFLPLFWERCRRFWRTVLYGFELSLFVEVQQLIFKVGSFDVDDLILNTIGAAAGFFCSRIFLWKIAQKRKKEGTGAGAA